MRTRMNSARSTVMPSKTLSLPMFVLAGTVILSLAILGCENSKPSSGEGSLAYGAGANVTPQINISAKIKGNDIVVELKVVNRGVDSFPLLKWNLPQDGNLTTDLFEVRRNDQIVEYTGRMVKRKVTQADFLEIKPSREFTATCGLAQGYEVGPRGRYTIQYTVWNEILGSKQVVSLKSDIAVLEK